MYEVAQAITAILKDNYDYDITYDPLADTVAHAVYLAADVRARDAFNAWARACEIAGDTYKAYIAAETLAANALSAWQTITK